MQVIAGTFLQPRGDPGSLVRGIVIEHEVDLHPRRDLPFDLVEKAHGFLLPMLSLALADDPAGGNLQRCEQGRCAVPIIIVGAAFGLAGPPGQDRLAAIQRLDLALLVHAEDDGPRPLWWMEVAADDVSRTFSTKNGSVESLKFSCQCGLRPKACQLRTMAFWFQPLAAAMGRVLQCVALAGRVSSVRVTTASTLASVSLRGCPGRGKSPSACSPPARKRSRHAPTVRAVTPNLAATA